MTAEQIALPALSESERNVSYEEESYATGFGCVAGVDEVGRGPLAGPVVAAAVVLPRKFSHPDIRDSKLLTAPQREKLAKVIKENAASWAVGMVEAKDIDQINILSASFVAMVKACEALQPIPDCLLIDGNKRIPREVFGLTPSLARFLPRQRVIIKGDQRCLSIAAASIVAKVARDSMMVDLDKVYPEYGFADHKGYGCPSHVEALRRFGPSPVHRRSFRPVLDACPEVPRPEIDRLFSES